MKPIQHLLGAVALASATFLPLAVAQNAPADAAPRAERGEMRQQRMAQRQPGEMRARHLERFKADLKLTPAQEPAWKAYTDALPKPPENRGDRRAEREADAKLSAPERMNKHASRMEERAAQMKKSAAAFQTFYNQLTPEQKKIADERSQRMGRGPHGDRQKNRGMRRDARGPQAQ